MRRGHETLAFALALALLASCSDPEGRSPPEPNVTDGWLGRWNGPEGTSLLLEGGNGRYQVTVQNLDGPRVFLGVGAGEQIRFERDGVTEFIRATDGVATGMKWLADKSTCLTIRFGEGYCRD
jgi:hypothetical protein